MAVILVVLLRQMSGALMAFCLKQGRLCQRLVKVQGMSAMLLLVRMPELVAVQQEPLRCSHEKQDGDQLLT